jgi:hypothetical protein
MFEGRTVECHQEIGQPVETLIPSVLDLTSSCQEVSRQNAYIYNFLKWLRNLSGAEMEIYIYFTDPNTKYIQTAKTSAFK